MENRENLIDVDEWWRGLTTEQKEHIATKVYNKLSFDERAALRGRTNIDVTFVNGKSIIRYPSCTKIWLDQDCLPYTRKMQIRNHCESDHDFKLGIWSEGNSFSY